MARAAPPALEVWLETADACEAMVAEQSEAGFDALPEAPPQLNMRGVKERAARHPQAPLIAYAAARRSRWFMCVVKADPPVGITEAAALVDGWAEIQAERIRQPENHAVAFEDKTTLQPIRALCQDEGRVTVSFAFIGAENDFRIGVVDRLPDAAPNPCLDLRPD